MSALWIFGYGSLIWRPDFLYVDTRDGFVEGFARRFWQGSTDHRGVPEAPGRVATLATLAGARCYGRAFRVAEAAREGVLARLDHRERGGFVRETVDVHCRVGGAVEPLRALVYIATPQNPNYLGPAPVDEIARQIVRATGPSGSNREYVMELARALREMNAPDEHVFALADAVARVCEV